MAKSIWLQGSIIQHNDVHIGDCHFRRIFIAYLYIKSGSQIDVSNYLIFQRVFSVTGFGMIPMPALPDLWTIHALMLFSPLVLSTLWVCSRDKRDKDLELAAFVAILGTGLAAYYVGRSHPLVLWLVAGRALSSSSFFLIALSAPRSPVWRRWRLLSPRHFHWRS